MVLSCRSRRMACIPERSVVGSCEASDAASGAR
jgi:hypothetical protein